MMLRIALLGLLAQADDTKEDVYKRLALGDRVEITFSSGRTLAGKVVGPAQREKIESLDFTKETSLTVDVSVEYPGLNGTMTIKKDVIKKIRILGELPKKDRDHIEEQKRRIEEEKKPPEEKPKPPTPKRDPFEKLPDVEKPQEKDPAAEAEKKKQEDLKKGEALYAKYPPPDWGPDRRTAIDLKRKRGIVIPPIEKEFLEGFDLWDLWRKKIEAEKKK